MANSTFNGPVRSENGFEQISITSGTGAITTNLDIDSSGNITTTGYLSAYKNVSSITDATKSVESTDSGTVYTLNRAAGIVVTLPTAAAGLTIPLSLVQPLQVQDKLIRTMPVTYSLALLRFLIQQQLPTIIPLSLMQAMTTPLIWEQQHRVG